MSRYKIKSIEKTDAPQNSTHLRWYKFIIENDKNTIVNFRSGTKEEILNFATESIKRLNEKYLTHIQFKTHKPVFESSISTYL